MCLPKVKEVPGVTFYLLLILDKAIYLGKALLVCDCCRSIESEMSLPHHHILVVIETLVGFIHTCLASAVRHTIVGTDGGS